MKRLIVLLICFMFMGTASSFAESLQRHTVEVGTEISHITYDEPGVMEEKGVMSGLFGSYAYHNNYMLRAEGRFSYGQVDYNGKLSNGTPYTINSIDDYILEFRGLGGYDFPILTTTILMPYIGFGYRYLNDDSSFDPAGYERESNYLYSPIGIEIITPFKNGWSIGFTFEYDYFWKGVQKSHLSDVNPSFNDVENDQNDGYGLRGSVEFQKKGDKVDYLIEPFIRYWNIDRSENANITYAGTLWGYGWEPENDSTEIGVKLGVGF